MEQTSKFHHQITQGSDYALIETDSILAYYGYEILDYAESLLDEKTRDAYWDNDEQNYKPACGFYLEIEVRFGDNHKFYFIEDKPLGIDCNALLLVHLTQALQNVVNMDFIKMHLEGVLK